MAKAEWEQIAMETNNQVHSKCTKRTLEAKGIRAKSAKNNIRPMRF